MDSLEFQEDYIFPSELKTGRVRYKPNNSNYKEDKLRLYPNPAGDYVVIEYTLANESGDSRLVFVDSKGLQVKTINLENKHNYLIVSIKDIPNGFYICTLLNNGNGVKTIKLTITK